MKQIVLASTSPYRKQQLETLGITFSCHKPLIDEEKEKDPNLKAKDLALHLSLLKAKSLAKNDQITIGGDQLVYFQGDILGKPGTKEKAKQQLQKMQGKTHELITALCVFNDLEPHSLLNITEIKIKPLSEQQIEHYIDLDNPIDCAGSYKIEKHGIQIIEEIRTSDFTAIQGLPLLSLSKKLTELGIKIP